MGARTWLGIRWTDRKGRVKVETGPKGYMNSRISGLQDHNRPVEVIGMFTPEEWEEAARLDQIEADLEAQD